MMYGYFYRFYHWLWPYEIYVWKYDYNVYKKWLAGKVETYNEFCGIHFYRIEGKWERYLRDEQWTYFREVHEVVGKFHMIYHVASIILGLLLVTLIFSL